ncbi:MAG: hypothetical protein GW894_03385 [Caldiserica bacterium]|nr:hypothetical protein [Caldisericota bacterium]
MSEQTKFKQTKIGKIPEDWEDGDLFVEVILNFTQEEKFILENDLNEQFLINLQNIYRSISRIIT